MVDSTFQISALMFAKLVLMCGVAGGVFALLLQDCFVHIYRLVLRVHRRFFPRYWYDRMERRLQRANAFRESRKNRVGGE